VESPGRSCGIHETNGQQCVAGRATIFSRIQRLVSFVGQNVFVGAIAACQVSRMLSS